MLYVTTGQLLRDWHVPTQDQIGVWLTAARERAGLTQAAAGAVLHVDAAQISKWERAAQRMVAESFLALVIHYRAEKELVNQLAVWRHAYPESVPGQGLRVAEPNVARAPQRKIISGERSHQKKRGA
jgi:transcriptional regulator with XRE-family HTH domain